MIKFGIKIWSTNGDCFKEVLGMLERKEIDFTELYLVPGSFRLEELELLKSSILAVHSPHDGHNFNVFSLDDQKKELFKNEIIKIDELKENPKEETVFAF